jgi:tRNA(Ile)-lysidine synthase
LALLVEIAADVDAKQHQGTGPGRALELIVAHVHHGLRGAAADEDAELVRNLSRQWHLPFNLLRIDVHRERSLSGGNLMAVARRLRYDALFALARAHSATLIATGHTADDRAETLLLNLARGAGPRGLAALRARRDDGVIRPLIDTRRFLLREWLRSQRIPWREDLSNEDRRYRRIRIREELIPWMETNLNSQAVDNLARTARILDELEAATTSAAEMICGQALRPSYPWEKRLDRAILSHHPISLQTLVVRRAAQLLTQDSCGLPLDRIDAALQSGRTRQLSSRIDLRIGADHLALRDRWFRVDTIAETPLRVGSSLEISGWRFDLYWGAPRERCDRWILQTDQITQPLRVRSRLPGDRFRPAGGVGTRKISRYMIDQSIPVEIRAGIPLILDHDGILWVVGHAGASRLAHPPKGDRVLHIQVTPPKWYTELEILP